MTIKGIEWQTMPPTKNDYGEVQPIPAQILHNRGISPDEAYDHLVPRKMSLSDPFLLQNMTEVVDRIEKAIKDRETICCSGDYDVDGLTSQSILAIALQHYKAKGLILMTPHRAWEGYGLHSHSLPTLQEKGVKLLITLDCGTTNIKEIAEARAMGMDVIVIDHHLPKVGEELPDAIIVNPHVGPPTPFLPCAAAGVTYAVARAMEQRMGMLPPSIDSLLLSLCAMGTVADVVPLTGENRLLVSKGLYEIHHSNHPGIISLCSQSGIELDSVNASDIGFQLAPRINAAGRVGKPDTARNVLLPRSKGEVNLSVYLLGLLNNQRKKRTKEALVAAHAQIYDRHGTKLPDLLISTNEASDVGIVGLVSSGLVGRYHRPALSFAIGGEFSTCSARSIPGVNIKSILDKHAHLFIRHGGHEMAAGLTIRTEMIDIVREALEAEKIPTDLLVPKRIADMTLSIEDIDIERYWQIASLGPFGNGNPEPIFRIPTPSSVRSVKRIGDGSHLTFSSGEVRFIAWGMGEYAEEIEKARRLCIYGTLQQDKFRKAGSVQIHVEDIRILT